MAISMRSMVSHFMFPGTIRQALLGDVATNSISSLRAGGLLSRLLPVALPASISLQLPTLRSIWESILKAVPKKKTSHRKKRQRFLAGKALRDVTNLGRCSGCGNIKRAHHLCPYCVREIKDMWNGRGTVEVESQKRAASEEAMAGWQSKNERRSANREARR